MRRDKQLRLCLTVSDLVDNEFDPIFIPTTERGRLVAEFPLSVRLANILQVAGVKLVGDLQGRSLAEFARVRNCGKTTLEELQGIVRRLQLGSSESRPPDVPRRDPDILQISDALQEVSLQELPLSVRLATVLSSCGYKKLADLDGAHLGDLLRVKNCGRKTIAELRALLQRAEAGEFTAEPAVDFDEALSTIVGSIDAAMRKLQGRNRKIVEERLIGNRGESRTLEDVGDEFGMTRERVRQIVKGTCEKMRRAGGPALARALEAVGQDLESRVVPLTAQLLSEHSSTPAESREHSPSFYVRVLDYMAPSIPIWAPTSIREGADDPQTEEMQAALEKWLRTTGDQPTTKQAFEHLRAQPNFTAVSAATFLSIVRRGRSTIVDFPYADQPRVRLRRLRLFDITLPVLGDSTEPLTPEEIIERARSRFGADAVMLSGRSAENALAAHPEVFRLGPRSFGLRKHFASSESERRSLADRFASLLRKENRPISTIEVFDKQNITLPRGVTSYELAEIAREDARFIDLGRRLFALARWGIEEREHIKDLLPKILSQADCPLTISEIHERLTRFRSATPTGLTNILRKHPKITRLDFDYYGLRAWGDSHNAYFVGRRSLVERAVRRVDPPISFGGLCEVFRIPIEGAVSDTLWKNCAGSAKLRRAPDRREPGTLLMHKAVSLEQAVAAIMRGLGRPSPAYELEWELRARFGELFDRVRLQQLEERLDKSPRFLRNADGAYFLDSDLDLGELDVDAIRAAATKALREELEILSCDDLLDRLETQGFDMEEMTRGILASVLRGSEGLEEVGHQRFRAK